jgi:hypothetical protein
LCPFSIPIGIEYKTSMFVWHRFGDFLPERLGWSGAQGITERPALGLRDFSETAARGRPLKGSSQLVLTNSGSHLLPSKVLSDEDAAKTQPAMKILGLVG